MYIVHNNQKETLFVSGIYTFASLDSLADQLTDVYLRSMQDTGSKLLEVTFAFQGLDSRAKRLVMSFLKGLAQRQKYKPVDDLIIHWHYDQHDLDMAEFGEILAEILPLNFEFREMESEVA